MSTRYYVKFYGQWFGISGSDQNPEASFLDNTPYVDGSMTRDFEDLPPNEQTAVQSAYSTKAAKAVVFARSL